MKTALTLGLLSLFALLMIACSDATANYSNTTAEEAKEVTAERGKALKFSNENSKLNFIGSKVTGHHDGGFNKFDGKVIVDGDTVKKVEVTIDMDSAWTDDDTEDDPQLTAHLKSEDFFFVSEYPQAKFVSTEIKAEDGKHTITGNLTMRGVTKSITFPANISVNDGKVSATAKFKIDRTKWEIVYKGVTDNLIKNDVGIEFDISAS